MKIGSAAAQPLAVRQQTMDPIRHLCLVAPSVSLMLTFGCAPSAPLSFSGYFPYPEPMKAYTTFWYASDDSSFSMPEDTLQIALSRCHIDTLVYPPWYSPSTTFEYAVRSRSFVSIEFFSVDAKHHTRAVSDTLDAGIYQFKIDARKMTSGVYFCRSRIGPVQSLKKFKLLR